MAELNSDLVQPPFGEVNAWKENGVVRVKATILMKPHVENAQTGLAIDASRSMTELFGTTGNVFFEGKPNYVEPIARKICEYLANFDSDGETTAIYYACGKFGATTHFIGELDAEKAAKQQFSIPADAGTGTRLVPAINFFLDHFKDAPWLICLFITDGLIDDLEETKALSKRLCEEMNAGTRGFTKFVIIGLGKEFADPESPASKALEELDDLDEDPQYAVEGQDLWDHKLAMNIRTLDQIFAEVVDSNAILCPSGASVVDSHGHEVHPEDGSSYSDGLPAMLRFTMPADSTGFTLRLPNGVVVEQNLSEIL